MTVPSDAATRNSDNFGAAKGIAARWRLTERAGRDLDILRTQRRDDIAGGET